MDTLTGKKHSIRQQTIATTVELFCGIGGFRLGVIDAADNWVIETQKDLARFPNSNEWARILTSPLDGQIGMSPALQWRYNFSRVFGVTQSTEDDLSLAVDTEV
jgi:hypothetical protein